MLFSPKEIQLTKIDLTLWTTILVISNYLISTQTNVPAFDKKWQLFALATLLGFVLHGLLVSKVTPSLTNLTPDTNTKNAIVDVVKFGTVFATRKALIDYFNNQPINLGETEWMTETGLTLGGYAIFHIVARDMLPNLGAHFQMGSDLVEFSMGYLLAKFVMTGTITEPNLYELGSYLAGFAAYYLGTKYIFTPEVGNIVSNVASKAAVVAGDVAGKAAVVAGDVADKASKEVAARI
jgi:hypothetical protein